jgi:hypothetical protein
VSSFAGAFLSRPPADEIEDSCQINIDSISAPAPLFVTDFAGSIYSARLDGLGERNFLYAQGNLTGIAYTEI